MPDNQLLHLLMCFWNWIVLKKDPYCLLLPFSWLIWPSSSLKCQWRFWVLENSYKIKFENKTHSQGSLTYQKLQTIKENGGISKHCSWGHQTARLIGNLQGYKIFVVWNGLIIINKMLKKELSKKITEGWKRQLMEEFLLEAEPEIAKPSMC